MKLIIASAVALVALVLPGVSNANTKMTKKAIIWAFCGKHYKPCELGRQAVAVSGCETGYTYSIWSKNGQYLGLFQMGTKERERWGFGNDPWEQALNAFKMFKWTSTHEPGDPWHRWSCRPDGSVAY